LAEQSNDEIVDTGHRLRHPFAGHPGFVFMEGHIAAVVQTIFNAPLGTDDFQQFLRVCPLCV